MPLRKEVPISLQLAQAAEKVEEQWSDKVGFDLRTWQPGNIILDIQVPISVGLRVVSKVVRRVEEVLNGQN